MAILKGKILINRDIFWTPIFQTHPLSEEQEVFKPARDIPYFSSFGFSSMFAHKSPGCFAHFPDTLPIFSNIFLICFQYVCAISYMFPYVFPWIFHEFPIFPTCFGWFSIESHGFADFPQLFPLIFPWLAAGPGDNGHLRILHAELPGDWSAWWFHHGMVIPPRIGIT